MPTFGWISRRGALASRWDLRRAGWTLCEETHDACHVCPGHILLVDAATVQTGVGLLPDIACWPRSRVMLLGIDEQETRAGMVRRGYGEALPCDVGLSELAARAERLAVAQGSIPRRLRAGPVDLDLFHRDGSVRGQWLHLNPREFCLLWRLAETGDMAVTREELLRDVWRLRHTPETNSVEVHISRLRRKLAEMGEYDVIETVPEGGYRLAATKPFMLARKQVTEACYVKTKNKRTVEEAGWRETQ